MSGTRDGGILGECRPDDDTREGTMRIRKQLLLGACVLALICTTAVTASASGAGDPAPSHGRGGVMHIKGKPRFFGASNSVLDYHGGPVMHTNSTFMIYWSPPGSTWQSGYMNAVNGFFQNVAADSGTGNNPYSTLMQYGD